MADLMINSIRLAGLGGKFSWKCSTETTLSFNGTNYHFEIQTTQWYAVVSASLYKPWRIVMKKNGRLVGRVVAEFNKKSSAEKCLRKIKESFRKGLFKTSDDNKYSKHLNEGLEHGDVISVPCSMGRHFGIYDKYNDSVIEYQSPTSSRLIVSGKGEICETKFEDFCKRIIKKYGHIDLRKHIFNDKYCYNDFGDEEKSCAGLLHCPFTEDKVVERARGFLKKGRYNAIKQNCETFAVYCKTGTAKSMQSLNNSEFIVDVAVRIGLFSVGVAVTIAVAVCIYQFGPILKDAISQMANSGCGMEQVCQAASPALDAAANKVGCMATEAACTPSVQCAGAGIGVPGVIGINLHNAVCQNKRMHF